MLLLPCSSENLENTQAGRPRVVPQWQIELCLLPADPVDSNYVLLWLQCVVVRDYTAVFISVMLKWHNFPTHLTCGF